MLKKTYSILAVAITTSACAVTAEEAKQELAEELSQTPLQDAIENRDHFSPLCDADGYPLPGNVNSKQAGETTVSEFCSAITGGDDDPAPTCDLEATNAELAGSSLDSALQMHEHFRCLCDDEGYPLVGNINAKAITTASQFCAAAKEKGLL